MHHQGKTAGFAAVLLLCSFTSVFAATNDGAKTWQGSRADLRVTCENINGVLVESPSKTRCYSAFRATLTICKENGFCQTQYWNGENVPSGGQSAFGGQSLSESSEDREMRNPLIYL